MRFFLLVFFSVAAFAQTPARTPAQQAACAQKTTQAREAVAQVQTLLNSWRNWQSTAVVEAALGREWFSLEDQEDLNYLFDLFRATTDERQKLTLRRSMENFMRQYAEETTRRARLVLGQPDELGYILICPPGAHAIDTNDAEKGCATRTGAQTGHILQDVSCYHAFHQLLDSGAIPANQTLFQYLNAH